jgi:hypothetical protein
MPKFLFYTGTAFCLFLALSSAASALRDLEDGSSSFIAIGGIVTTHAAWAILVALFASLAVSAIFLRMAALVAARNLFAAFVAVFSVSAAVASLVFVLMLQLRMLRSRTVFESLSDTHLASVFALGWFVSATLLAMRPYFRVQASRILSILVFLPLPLFALIVGQELFVNASRAPLPAATPAVIVYFAVLSVLFFSIAVHCVRHRYLFLEMTNLRELLDSRVDPAARATRRTIGGVAFDS